MTGIKKRNLNFAMSARLKSMVTLVVLGTWSVAGADLPGFKHNVLRGSGEVAERTPRIINGVVVEDLRYPYFSLMFGQGMCGGVLIAPQLVLSAAHCDGAADLFRIGAFEDTRDGQHVTIRSAIKHPEYDISRFDYDIMIVQLEDKSDHPYISLEKEIIDGGKFTVVGFGDTDKGAPLELSPSLVEVELNYVDNDICDDGHGGKGEVTEDMMCVSDDDKDSCIGDSGGPLIRKGDSTGEDKLVGLVSWGRECAKNGVPGVYVRISYFYDWIIKTVCENFPEDAPPYMRCQPKYADWFIIGDRPVKEPTESPTTQRSLNPTGSAAGPFPTISSFPTDELENETESLGILEEAVFISWEESDLQECEGDCDNDDECADDLVCFKRNAETDHSPGCLGYEFIGDNVDVCISPIFLP